MARPREGWELRPLTKGRRTRVVRFTVNGRRVERSTGESDLAKATEAAERIYTDAIQRAGEQPRKVVRRGSTEPLDVLIARWLETNSTLDPDTVRMLESVGRHWLDHWQTLADITDVTCKDYRDVRLRKVQASTVRKELWALRQFLEWCNDQGHLPRTVKLPKVGAKVLGEPYPKRRRVAAPELSPEQVQAFLDALPEWSGSKRVKRFAVRARFVVQYWTGLRPSTISGLETPKHWQPGSRWLTVTPDIDKTREGKKKPRRVPLTDTAFDALTAVAPKRGLIFGQHDYREHVAKAAAAALPPADAAKFTGAHLRSARATHLLEKTKNVAGVMHILGHARLESTTRYTRPTERAAEAALADAGEGFRGQSRNFGDSRRAKRKRKAK